MSFYKRYILLNLNEYDSFAGFDFYVTIFLWVLTAALCVGIFIANRRKNNMIKTVKQLIRHGARSEDSAKTLSELGLEVDTAKKLLADGSRMSRFVKRVGARTLTYEEYVASIKRKKRSEKKKDAASAACPTPDIATVTEKPECTGEQKDETFTEGGETPAKTDGAMQTPEESPIADSGTEPTQEQQTVDFTNARFYIPEDAQTEAKGILNKRTVSLWQNILACVFLISISACLTFLLPELFDILDRFISQN